MVHGRESRLREFAERYTAAWCSQEPARVADCFSPAGSLTINGGPPAVGRRAIADAAHGFMTAFPDMEVRMDELLDRDVRASRRPVEACPGHVQPFGG